MWLWYGLREGWFVGGSLNEPKELNKLLETITLHVARELGQHYFNFQTIVDEFVAAHAVVVVRDFEQAASALVDIIQNTAKAQALNDAAQLIMQKNTGSLQKHIQVIDQYL